MKVGDMVKYKGGIGTRLIGIIVRSSYNGIDILSHDGTIMRNLAQSAFEVIHESR